MRVSVALFTADLRAHDNPVLVAALRDTDRVVPLFVVDTGIRRTGFAVPNRAAFLAESLADLDAALRARGGRLVQARRFDPDGGYVRRWLPELRDLDARTIHRLPHLDDDSRAGLGYPAPIVEIAAGAARFREKRDPGD